MIGSREILLWLASNVRGNSQQVRTARGPEILSIIKRELEKLKSAEKKRKIDRNAVINP